MFDLYESVKTRILEESHNLELNQPFDNIVTSVATVLLSAAYSDLDLDSREIDEVIKLLKGEFAIDKSAEKMLIELSVEISKNPSALNQCISLINSEYGDSARKRILAMVWKIIAIDGKIEHSERELAFYLEEKLDLTEDQAFEARNMVIKNSI